MYEKTIIVVEGEEACKMFDCFVAYKKLIGAAEMPKFSEDADTVDIIAMPAAAQTVVAKSRTKTSS